MVSAQEFNDRNRVLIDDLNKSLERFKRASFQRWNLFNEILIEAKTITEKNRPKIMADLSSLLKSIEEEGKDLEAMDTSLRKFFTDAREVRQLAEKRVIFKSVPNFKHLSIGYFRVLDQVGYDIYDLFYLMKRNNKRERRYIKAILGHWYTRQGTVEDFQKKFSSNYSACLTHTMHAAEDAKPVLSRLQASQRNLKSKGQEFKNMLESLPGFSQIDQADKLLLGMFLVGLSRMPSIDYVIGCAGAVAAAFIARKVTA